MKTGMGNRMKPLLACPYCNYWTHWQNDNESMLKWHHHIKYHVDELQAQEKKKADYKWKSKDTYILRKLRNSRAVKIKAGYSRDVGAGFICDDIKLIDVKERLIWHPRKKRHSKKVNLLITFAWGTQEFKMVDLNLRETEEAIRFIQKRIAEQQLEQASNLAWK